MLKLIKKALLRRWGVTNEVLEAAAQMAALEQLSQERYQRDPRNAFFWLDRQLADAVLNRPADLEVFATFKPLHPHATRQVMAEVYAERGRQDAKWGEQNHPNGTDSFSPALSRELAEAQQTRVNEKARAGTLTYQDIFEEEVLEAYAETDAGKLRAELVQVVAVGVAWIEKIDRDEQKVDLNQIEVYVRQGHTMRCASKLVWSAACTCGVWAPFAGDNAEPAGEDHGPEAPVAELVELEQPEPLDEVAVQAYMEGRVFRSSE